MIHNSNVQSVETPGYRRARQDYEKQKGPDMLKSIFPTVGGSGGSGGGVDPTRPTQRSFDFIYYI